MAWLRPDRLHEKGEPAGASGGADNDPEWAGPPRGDSAGGVDVGVLVARNEIALLVVNVQIQVGTHVLLRAHVDDCARPRFEDHVERLLLAFGDEPGVHPRETHAPARADFPRSQVAVTKEIVSKWIRR